MKISDKEIRRLSEFRYPINFPGNEESEHLAFLKRSAYANGFKDGYNNKRKLASIMSILTCGVIIYLIGVFISLEWNPTLWMDYGRISSGCLFLFLSLLII